MIRDAAESFLADVSDSAAVRKAMAALGVDARRCAVVEDSVTGITAGAAAGATVYAYAPQGDADPLYRAGASHVFTDMAQLPALLG